jgi:hypothetical protein
MNKWDWVAEGHLKFAKFQTYIAQESSREAKRAWSDAITALNRTKVAIEESRRKLSRSDALLRWAERYGPARSEPESESE